MSVEDIIIKDIKERNGKVFVTVGDKDQTYGSFYCEWKHEFCTQRLNIRRDGLDEAEELMYLIKKDLGQYVEDVRSKEYPFRTITFKGDIKKVTEYITKKKREHLIDKIREVFNVEKSRSNLEDKLDNDLKDLKRIQEDIRKVKLKIEDDNLSKRSVEEKEHQIKKYRLREIQIKEEIDDLGIKIDAFSNKIWVEGYKRFLEDKFYQINSLFEKYKSPRECLKRTIKSLDKDGVLNHVLRNVLNEHDKSKNKKGYCVVNAIETGHYNEYIRWNIGPFSSIAELDDRVINALKKKKEADKILESMGRKRKFPKGLEKIIDEINSEIGGIGYTKISKDKDLNKKVIDIILYSAEHLRWKRMISPEEMLSMGWAILDIEKPKFGSIDEEVSWVSLVYSLDDKMIREVHTSKDADKKIINSYSIISQYKDEEELIQGVIDSINNKDISVLGIYNAKYDLLELREAQEDRGKNFGIGERKKGPVKDVTTSFFERVRVSGRIVFDFLDWAKIFFDHLPNKKLVMVGKEVLGKEAFSKIIDYNQQRELEYIAEGDEPKKYSDDTLKRLSNYYGYDIEDIKEGRIKGINFRASEIIARYVSDDTEALVKLFLDKRFRKTLDVVEFFCNFSKVDYAAMLHSKNNVNNAQKKCFFEKIGSHRDLIFGQGKKTREKRAKDREFFKKDLFGNVNVKNDTGLFKDITVAYVPRWISLCDLIKKRFGRIKEVKEYYDNIKDVELKRMFSLYADKLTDLLVEDYSFYIQERDDLVKICCETYQQIKGQEIDENKDHGKKRKIHSIRWSSLYPEERRFVSDIDCLLNNIYKNIKKSKYEALYKRMRSGQVNQKDLCFLLEDKNQAWFFEKYNISINKVRYLFNRWQKVNKKKVNVIGEYNVDPWEMESVNVELFSHNLNEFFKENEVEVLCHKSNYLFLKNLSKDIQEKGLQKGYIIPADNIGRGLFCKGSGAKDKKIFYMKNGYFSGTLKKEDEPTYYHSVHEMQTFACFIQAVLDGDHVQALKDLYYDLDMLNEIPDGDDYRLKMLKDFKLAKKDLVMHSKSSDVYRGYEDGEIVKFYIKEWTKGNDKFYKVIGDKEVEFCVKHDKVSKRDYVMEPFITKDPKTKRETLNYSKRYIMEMTDFIPDKRLYVKRFNKFAMMLLEPLIGVKDSLRLTENDEVLDDQFFYDAAKKIKVR